MLVPKVLASIALLARTVLGDGAAIYDALATINTNTLDLQSKVQSWSGGLLGTLPIIVESTELLAAIKNGTRTAESSAPLSAIEAITVAGETVTLSNSVTSTLSTIVQNKPRFDKLLLSPVILLNLQLEKQATDQMSSAIIAKVPEELQATAQSLIAPIDAAFDQAIDAYNPFG